MSDAGFFKGTNYTLQDADPHVMSTSPQSKYVGAGLYCASDTVVPSGTDLGAGSTLHVAKLPAGSVVKYSIVYPITAAGVPTVLSNAVTFKIGITGDTDLFGDVTTMASSALPQVIAPVPDGTTFTSLTDFALESDADVFLTTAAAELVAAEGLSVSIYYTVG